MLKIELITPQKKILEKEASEIVVSTLAGEIGILEGHTNLLSIIRSGLLVIHNKGEKSCFAVHHGFVQVKSDKISVAVKLCEEKIDLERATLSEKNTTEKIKTIEKTADKNKTDIQEKLKNKIHRSQTRQQLASK